MPQIVMNGSVCWVLWLASQMTLMSAPHYFMITTAEIFMAGRRHNHDGWEIKDIMPTRHPILFLLSTGGDR